VAGVRLARFNTYALLRSQSQKVGDYIVRWSGETRRGWRCPVSFRDGVAVSEFRRLSGWAVDGSVRDELSVPDLKLKWGVLRGYGGELWLVVTGRCKYRGEVR